MQWCTPTMQLYIIKRQSNRATALEDLTLCIQDIMFWNVSNMLKRKPKKTEFIHFSSHSSPAEPIPSIKVGDSPISLSNEVKNLGVTVESLLTFKTYISNDCYWPPHVLFISSEKKIGSFYLDLLRNVLFTHFLLKTGLLQQHSSRTTLLWGRETTTVAKYSRKASC